MTRTYSSLITAESRVQLDLLANRESSQHVYRDALTQIGEHLGEAVSAKIEDDNATVYLACTVEDADFLAKGMLNQLEQRLQSVALACFWNERYSPFGIEGLKIAPIIKKYQEPTDKCVNYLVVIKSIIFGACVVKTNLTNLIQDIKPNEIFIVAPVIYSQAEQKLKAEFEESVYKKFHFLYLAQDNQCNSKGEVIPGIGGMIYDRLGLQGQQGKNRYVPNIVKSRRSRLISKL